MSLGKNIKAYSRLVRKRGSRMQAERSIAKIKRGTLKDRTKELLSKRGLRSIGKAAFGNRRLKYSDGFGTGHLGIFSEAANKSSKKTKVDYDLPEIKQPKRVSNDNNPSISSIETQLSGLVSAAVKIGTVGKSQQDGLITQLRQTEQTDNESRLEHPNASLEPQMGGPDLSPLSDTFDEVRKKLGILGDALDQSLKNNANDNDIGGRGRNRGGKVKVEGRSGKYNAAELLDKNGKELKGAALTSRLNKVDEAARVARSGRLLPRLAGGAGRALGSIAKLIPGATAVGGLISKAGLAAGRGLGAVGQGTRGITNILRSGITKAGGGVATRVVNTSLIKKLALPIIEKGVGKTVLKSIPIIGAVAGVGFAVGRLLEGDPVGAGLDAVSGLAGPVTAIPALILSTARDIYSAIYGTQPEEDAEAGVRLPLVTSTVKALVASVISSSVKPKDKPSGTRTPATSPKAPPLVNNTASQQKPVNVPAPVSLPAVSPASKTPAAPAASPDSGGSTSGPAASPATGNSSSPTSPGLPTPEAPATKSPDAMANKSETAEPVPPSAKSGENIDKASMDNESLATTTTPSIQVQGNETAKPATEITSRNGVTGIGNVPDPTYGGMGTIAEQLYFGARV